MASKKPRRRASSESSESGSPAPGTASPSPPQAEQVYEAEVLDDESLDLEQNPIAVSAEAESETEVLDVDGDLASEQELGSPSEATAPRKRRALAVPSKKGLERSGGDPLAAYMREVQRHPLLSRDEEHNLAVLYTEKGDVEAAKKLVTSNLRLVVKIAYEYKRAHKNMMDLVQEGNIGLMHAVKRYDPHRGVKLSSYSAWWIRAYILRFILNNWRLVKLGTTQAQRKLFFNLNKERARLAAMGIEPTHDEIAKRLDVETKEVAEMDMRLGAGDASLDVPVGDSDGKQTTRLDLMPTTDAGPDTLAENHELMGMLREHLKVFRETLEGKELQIFDRRMIAEEPLTLQELGNDFGVSRERVRQLEVRVTRRLRAFLTECLGDAVTNVDAAAH